MRNWKDELQQATRQAKAKVIGANRIEQVQHANLVRVALEAFGDDPRATFFIEGLPPAGDIPRPDLILLHPNVGVLIIENKGIELDGILDVHDTLLRLIRNGVPKEEDPFKQAEKVMYRLKDLCKLRMDIQDALFLRTAAFPRIRRAEFERRFGTHLLPETLFADACASSQAFLAQIRELSNAGQRSAHKTCKLSKRASDAIMTILSGKALFHAPRRRYIEDTDPNLLGVQIQEMELALKEATHDQKELGKADLRGTHRLFRGVAGSGKSIMLALNVAQTLLNFKDEETSLFDGSQPPRKVLALCYNRTLVYYLRNKIEDRYGRIAWDEPTEDRLIVTHFEGLVREIEAKYPALETGLDFTKKEERTKALCTAFDKLDPKAKHDIVFDAIYVDEAQDLIPAEFELLLRLARKDKDGKQTLVIFYDNAQNIYGVTPPTWGELGINIKGGRTVFLDKCLRNTTQILAFAFNVLVGSFAPEGQRVATRQFADVASLKERKLISEQGDRYDIHFSLRTGPLPVVNAYPDRAAEIAGVVEKIKQLVTQEKVLPSDILLLYKSHFSFGNLAKKVKTIIGPEFTIRTVDSQHSQAKNYPLMEDGVMTFSTIASAKGYDAPVVFLLGVDELDTDPQGRASFYVGATRTKLCLYVSGVKQAEPGLLDEIMLASDAVAGRKAVVPLITRPTIAAATIPTSSMKPSAVANSDAHKKSCRACGSQRLHAQYGKFGYFYVCIDCTKNTPIDLTCPKCSKKGRIRKDKLDFFRECEPCGFSELVHRNVPLDSL